MTETIKRIIYMLAGLCAGLTAFALMELLDRAGFSTFLLLSLSQGAALGLVFGFVLGFTDGIFYKELKSGLVKGLTAAVTGAAVAAAARLLSAQGMLFSAGFFKTAAVSSGFLLPLWRGTGWMLMGAAIGSIDGIFHRSPRRTAAGAAGGLAGGLTGGLCFELLINRLPGLPASGAVGLVLMGILIGLFIGEFERRFSYGRLRILNGRLKDREYLLIERKTTAGGALKNDIYIHGYSNVPSGTFSRESGETYLVIPEKEGTAGGAAESTGQNFTMLNDRPAAGRKSLKYQDVVRLGSVKLLYLPL